MIITSKDNTLVKEIRKLKEKKYRTDKFVVEGIKMIKEAINENMIIDTIIVREGVKVEFDVSKYNLIEVSEGVFKDLTDVVSPQGVIAVVKKNEDDKINSEADYIIALDGIQDPGNFGTIIRTADSANIKQIIVSKNTVDAYSPKVVRSTMGAIYRVNIIEAESLADTLKGLNHQGFEIVVTSLNADKSIYDVDYSKKIVVIGNEAQGVSSDVMNIATHKVKIPMMGKTESLNASVAAGIMIYEYVRQGI